MSADILSGLAAIAEHVGLTVPATKARIKGDHWPTFKQGRIVCARRSELEAHFARASASRRSGDDTVAVPVPDGLLYGYRAIAAHLGMPTVNVEQLDVARQLPTYREDGCTVASTAALNHWNIMKGGR